MADRHRTPVPNSMVASARLLAGPTVPSSSYVSDQPRTEEWQEEAWYMLDTQPELRFGITWKKNAASRCRLFAARRPRNRGDEPEPIEDGPAVDLVASLGNGIGGQAQLIASTVVQLSVPGVGYLVGEIEAQDTDAQWAIYSTKEVRQKAAASTKRPALYEVQVDRSTWRALPPESHIARIWSPHERFHWAPDSPVRALLPVLRELERLSQHIDASAISRLAGAGILFIPSEMTFPARPEHADAPDPFMAEFFEVITTAIKDRTSAAAVAPLVVRVPAQYIDKILHLTFSTPLDERAIALRDSAIKRVAVGLDVQQEVLTGMGDVSHWGQWFLGEEGIKIHVDPMMESIVHAYTVGYLRPGLRAANAFDPDIVIWYDTTELAMRPDRSDDTLAAYDRLEASGDALRRELGLDPGDAPDPMELAAMAFKQLIRLSPQLAPLGLSGLGITDTTPATGAPVETTPVPEVGAEPVAPTAGAPTQGPPEPTAAVAATYPLVFRALERAGNRLRSHKRGKMNGQTDCAPELMHTCMDVKTCGIKIPTLLEGAWEQVPMIAALLGVSNAPLVSALDSYTCGLLETGSALTPEGLFGALTAGAAS